MVKKESKRLTLLIALLIVSVFSTCIVKAQTTVETDSSVSHNKMESLRPVGEILDSLDDIAAKYTGHSAYILDIDYVVENVFRQKGYRTEQYKRTLMSKQYVVLDHTDPEFSTMTLELQNGEEELVAFKAQVVLRNGEMGVYDRADLEWTGKEQATAKLVFDNIRDGAVVHIVYETVEALPDGLIRGFIPLQFSVPVRSLDVYVLLPQRLLFRFKEIREGYIPHYTVSESGFLDLSTFHFARRNIEPLKSEPFSPDPMSSLEYAAYIIAGVQSDDSVLHLFSTNVGEALQTFVKREADRAGVRFIRRFTQELIEESGAVEKDEIVDVIVQYVREHMTENATVDKPTYQELIATGQGDKWTITELLHAMLDHARIETEFIVIHDPRFGYLDKQFVDGSMRTPALRFAYKGENVVCFPYMSNLRLGMIPPHVHDEVAYSIAGYNGVGTYDTIVAPSRHGYNIREEFAIHIDSNAQVHVEEVTKFQGASAFAVEQRYQEAKQSGRLTAFFESFTTYDDGIIQPTNPSFTVTYDSLYSVVVSVTYTIDNLVTMLPSEVIFLTGGLLSSNVSEPEMVTDVPRTNPIVIPRFETIEQHIHISYPITWTKVTEIPEYSIANSIGRASVSATTNAGSITITKSRELDQGRWDKEMAADLLELIHFRISAEVPTLVFKK